MTFNPHQLTIQLRDQLTSDPYPVYAEMRRLNQPLFVPHHPADSTKAPGKWLLSTYAQAEWILNNAAHFTKNNSAFRRSGPEPGFDESMLFRDEPEHRKLRQMVEDLFRRSAIQRYAQAAQDKVKSLLTNMEYGSEIDLVDAFAEPLPLLVIMDLLGIPEFQMSTVRNLSRSITAASDDLTLNEESHVAKATAYRELTSLMHAGINGEWKPPEESLIGRLRHLATHSALTKDQAISMLILLLFAGHETTISLISSCLYLLFTHPEQLQRLQANPDLLTGAIEETLRFESPLQRTTFRMTKSDVLIAGEQFGPGEQIAAILGSANRDEKIFNNPDHFIIDRFPNPHLAFGRGSYHCIGRHLSVLETQIAIKEFLSCFGRSSLVNKPQWQHNSFIRALHRLPVYLAS